MTDHERAMLLSVRPRYAESILAGGKRVEIRRQRPGVTPGTPVIIYATKPVGAVVGTAIIDRVRPGPPSELWAHYREEMGVTQDEFEQYVGDLTTVYLLLLTDASRLPVPLTLSDMRESADFQPPQSYRYLSHDTLRALVDGHPARIPLLSLLQCPHAAYSRDFARTCAEATGSPR